MLSEQGRCLHLVLRKEAASVGTRRYGGVQRQERILGYRNIFQKERDSKALNSRRPQGEEGRDQGHTVPRFFSDNTLKSWKTTKAEKKSR